MEGSSAPDSRVALGTRCRQAQVPTQEAQREPRVFDLVGLRIGMVSGLVHDQLDIGASCLETFHVRTNLPDRARAVVLPGDDEQRGAHGIGVSRR